MNFGVLILSCVLAAAESSLVEENVGDEGLTASLNKPDNIDDQFPRVAISMPLVQNKLSNLNRFIGDIPISETLVQSPNFSGVLRNHLNPVEQINCGKLPCPKTLFVCPSGPCQYPSEFDELITKCRSTLQKAEETFQSIAKFLLPGKMTRGEAFIKTADTDTLHEASEAILAEVEANIASLQRLVPNEVIGQVAQDVLIDMETLHTVIIALVKTLNEVDKKVEEMKIPMVVYDRSFRPTDWTPQCSGRWPCTRIQLYSTLYGYSQQKLGCGCQLTGFRYGSRMIQSTPEYSYQLPAQKILYHQYPSQIYSQTLPLVVRQSLFSKPLAPAQLQAAVHQPTQVVVVTQPQTPYEKVESITTEHSMPIASVLSSLLSKTRAVASNIQPSIIQTDPQIIYQPAYQVVKSSQTIHPSEAAVQLRTILNQSVNPQQSILYPITQYRTVKQYVSPIYNFENEELIPVSNNISIPVQYKQNLQIPSATLPILPGPILYTHFQPLLNSTMQQQHEIDHMGFVQQQLYNQPMYTIQYKPPTYLTGRRASANSTEEKGLYKETLQPQTPQFQNQQVIHPAALNAENPTRLVRNANNSTGSNM